MGLKIFRVKKITQVKFLALILIGITGIAFYTTEVLAEECRTCQSSAGPVCDWTDYETQPCTYACAFNWDACDTNSILIGTEQSGPCSSITGCPDSFENNYCLEKTVGGIGCTPITRSWNMSEPNGVACHTSVDASDDASSSSCTKSGCWDESSKSCIRCWGGAACGSGLREDDLYASNNNFYCSFKQGTGYGKCESACGADSECDEASYGLGISVTGGTCNNCVFSASATTTTTTTIPGTTTTTTTTIPSGPGICVYNANPPTYVYAGTCYDSGSENCTGACPSGYERDSQPCGGSVDCTQCDPGDDRCCDCKCDLDADGTCPAGCPGDPDCGTTTTTTTAPGPTTTTAPGPTTTTAPSGPVWPVTFSNPINATTFEELIVSIINWLLAIIGSIVLLFIIIGGIMYMTAAGNEEQIKRAKRILFYTILGFAVVLISYSLIQEIKKILGI